MYSIILAGGSGTRLFPLSRSTFPKQFIPLTGNDSLFQKAVKRASLFSKPDEIYIVTNKEHKFLVQNQLLSLRLNCNVLLEPCGKNTLPAILYGVLEISKKDSSANILVLSSDQLIEESEQYMNAVRNAEILASTHIVTFGVVPTAPLTGYGYIKPGAVLNNGYIVAEFKEKPDIDTAKEYLEQKYLWNAGIFCFSATIFIDECKRYAPDIYSIFASNTVDVAYNRTPKQSMDYGILEKSQRVAVVPMETVWNDLGTFEALYSIHSKDIDGNAIDGEYVSENSKNNLIISNKLVATIGVSDFAIVDTPDVLLICPRTQSQAVGKLAESLKLKGDERAVIHRTVNRPWGVYSTLLKSETYLIKRLVINPHSRISLQYHNHRSEHWVVVTGRAEVTNGNVVSVIELGESTFIPAKTIHRLANPTDNPLEVIEVQQGFPLTEDDIVRLDDDFKRVGDS